MVFPVFVHVRFSVAVSFAFSYKNKEGPYIKEILKVARNSITTATPALAQKIAISSLLRFPVTRQ